ncbi:tetratricopeptide repeat protein [Thermoclostridium stercorarium]
MEKAFRLNPRDERVFMELDQLYKKLGMSFEERLKNYEAHKELIERRDDLYTEYVTLLNMCGYYEKAYECIMGHRFHPWEGGEGKIATQYKLSLLEMAAKAKAEGHFCDAERLLRQALVYPENLGEGKLEGTKDNHIYYNLGLVLEALGKIQEAKECYERATEGNYEPKGIMYYYDQPADMILYQGLAYQKLGRIAEAKSRFYRLIDYGEQHLDDEVKIDYFAVSLPDFGIFEEDYTIRNRAHCFYLMALGNIGLGNFEKAKNFLDEAVKIEPSHMMCRVYQRYLADRT